MEIALENIRSLYNVGSILRTAGFFGVKKVLLVGYSGRKKENVDELNKEVKKTSLGAEKDLKIKFVKDGRELIKWVKENKLKLVAVEQAKGSVKINQWQVKKNSVIVFGNEVEGVSEEILKAADEIVEIPRQGGKESLNVAVTAGIVMGRMIKSI